MGDITRKRLYEMLECVKDPVIGKRARNSRTMFYCDVTLAFSDNQSEAADRMRAKGFAPLVNWPQGEIILGTCRGYKYGMGDDGDARLDRKVGKYRRWLRQWKQT